MTTFFNHLWEKLFHFVVMENTCERDGERATAETFFLENFRVTYESVRNITICEAKKLWFFSFARFLPTHNRFLPTHNRFLPTHNRFLPTHNRLLPTHNRFLPTQNRFLPTQNRKPPSTGDVKPSK